MADSTENKNGRNDEVDLLDLFRRLGKWSGNIFQKIYIGLLISLVFVLKKSIYLILTVIFGVILAYFMNKSSIDVYTSEMVIKPNAVPPYEIITQINKLHKFCTEGNVEELAGSLGLENEQIISIADIQAFWIIDKGKDDIPDYVDYSGQYNVNDTNSVRMKDRLAVVVSTTSPQGLSEIRDGILRFIESNKHISELNKIRLEQTAEMYRRISYDISQLDSLQRVKYFFDDKNKYEEMGGLLVLAREKSPELIVDEIHELYSLKQHYKKVLDLYDDAATVMSDFSAPGIPLNNIMTHIKRIVPKLIVLCLLVLIIIHNRYLLIDIYKKYK